MARVVVLLAGIACAHDPTPKPPLPPLNRSNSIYDASKHSQKLREVQNGVLYQVSAPENATMSVMHLFGTAEERGFAHGALLSEELLTFGFEELPRFFEEQVFDALPLDKLPKAIADVIRKMVDAATPGVVSTALELIADLQHPFIDASYHIEAEAIAKGACDAYGKLAGCDATLLGKRIRELNMIPELLRMQCSMMGAWGPATPTSSLVQLRTLDFGAGPFANRNVLVVHHPTDGPHAFASLSFPGFVGAVTGFSERLGQSEKVDDVTGGQRPEGTYVGEADAYVIRDMLQHAETKEEAVAIAQQAHRTWSMWLGLGDYASQEFVAVLYDHAEALPLDDTTLPNRTSQKAFDSVAYIDKHAQPSSHADMPALVEQHYGNLTAENVVQQFPRLMRSGDVHVTVYDYELGRTFLSSGSTDAAGNFIRLACDAPFLVFDNSQLWAEPRPALVV